MIAVARIAGMPWVGAMMVVASLAMPGCEVLFPVDDGVSNGARTPCAKSHAFCADFDDGPLSKHPEYVPFTKAGGRLTVDTTNARSQPGALLASCDALPVSSDPTFAFLGPTLQGSLTNMRLAFAIKIDVRGSSGNPIATIGVHDASDQLYNVQLSVESDGHWSIGEYRPTGMPVLYSHPTEAVVGSDWMQIAFEVHVGGGDDYASLTIDEHPVLAHQHLEPSITSGAPVFAIGFTSLYGPSTPWAVRFDDVTFDD